MIGQMAIAITLLGLNNRGHFVTPTFLLMDHFLYWFSTFSKKKEKMHHRFLFVLALCLSVRRVQIPLGG